MPRSFRTFVTAVVAALLLPVPASADVGATATLDTVTTQSIYGCLRTNGAAVYDAAVNKTFVTYSGSNQDIFIKAYDHAANTWSAAVKVATLNVTNNNAYHDYPLLRQLSDGRLVIFRAAHTVSGHMYTAPTAHAITGSWSARQISSDRNGYLEPIITGNNIYLFYSQNTDIGYPYRTYRIIKSTDSGQTWSAPQTVIDSGRTADKFAETYAFGVVERNGRIYISWSQHGGPAGHNMAGKNIYVAYYDTADATMHTVAGTNLGAGITGGELAQTQVVATNPNDLPAGKTLPEENPVAVPMADGSVILGYGVGTANSARIVLARFANGAWTSTTIDSTTSLFKDIVANGDSVEFIYATANRARLISKTWSPTAGQATVFDIAVPYSGGADTVFYANFVEKRGGISVIASTINQATRKDVHTGRWPIFAIKN
jgi:hypothetical protein